MMIKEYQVKDKEGMHARPASLLVKKAASYDNPITITYKEKEVTLKSIMAVMSLGIRYEDTFAIKVEGDDAQAIQADFEQFLVENQLV
jgi:phosphocarrier protein